MGSDTVVVVDDEQALLDILHLSLSSHGYKVITVSNGFRAIDIIKHAKPAIVLLDIVMPEINGWEVLRCLEDKSETAGLAIIMISAIPPDHGMNKMLDDNVLYYQKKPFNFEQLLQKMHSVKNQHNVQDLDVLRNYLSEKRNKYLKEIDL